MCLLNIGEASGPGLSTNRPGEDAPNALLLLRQHVGPLARPLDHICVTETRSGNSQLLHLVDQRGALHAKFGGCTLWAADHPADGLESAQDQAAFGVP
jgi:hypothetical protein